MVAVPIIPIFLPILWLQYIRYRNRDSENERKERVRLRKTCAWVGELCGGRG